MGTGDCSIFLLIIAFSGVRIATAMFNKVVMHLKTRLTDVKLKGSILPPVAVLLVALLKLEHEADVGHGTHEYCGIPVLIGLSTRVED